MFHRLRHDEKPCDKRVLFIPVYRFPCNIEDHIRTYGPSQNQKIKNEMFWIPAEVWRIIESFQSKLFERFPHNINHLPLPKATTIDSSDGFNDVAISSSACSRWEHLRRVPNVIVDNFKFHQEIFLKMSAVINFLTRRLLPISSNDDHFGGFAETEGLLNSLYINLVLFAFFMIFFEANRHMKSTYLKRATKKFKVLRQNNQFQTADISVAWYRCSRFDLPRCYADDNCR